MKYDEVKIESLDGATIKTARWLKHTRIGGNRWDYVPSTEDDAFSNIVIELQDGRCVRLIAEGWESEGIGLYEDTPYAK